MSSDPAVPRSSKRRADTNSYDTTITSFEAELADAELPDLTQDDRISEVVAAAAPVWAQLLEVIDVNWSPRASARMTAARKLITNHENVLRDITNATPHTQLQLERVDASLAQYVDQALRETARRLLGRLPGASDILQEELDGTAPTQAAAWAQTAAFLDARIQSLPNERPGRATDMSPAAATAMRSVLQQLWWVAHKATK